jgi:hypothetical protein
VAPVSSVQAGAARPATFAQTGTCQAFASDVDPSARYGLWATASLGSPSQRASADTRGAPVWSRNGASTAATSRPAAAESAERKSAIVALPHAWRSR